MTDDLVAFLRARYDDDEALAHRGWSSTTVVQETEHGPVFGHGYPPARVLAEVDAKRRIIDAHPITHQVVRYGGSKQAFGCETCHDWDGATMGEGYCDTLKALAPPYADHADYREEWRP